MSNQLAPGVRRGKWTLSSFTPGSRKDTPRTYPTWLCVCDCGSTRKVRSDRLISGGSRSCGCTIAAVHTREISSALTTGKKRPML